MNTPQRPDQQPTCLPQPRQNPVETVGWLGLLAAVALALLGSKK